MSERESIIGPIAWTFGLGVFGGYAIWAIASGSGPQWAWGAIVGGNFVLIFTEWITWGYRGIIERYQALADELITDADHASH